MVIELAVAVMIFSDRGNGRRQAMDTAQALSSPPPPHGGNAEACVVSSGGRLDRISRSLCPLRERH